MKAVEPIRDIKKITAIKELLKQESNPRNYLLFVLGVNLGLRISDLLRLKIKDVLDSQGNIAEYINIRESKTKKEKKIKINQISREAIEYFFKNVKLNEPDQYLFRSEEENKPIDRVRVWQLIQSWTRKVGLKGNFGTHTLRKTWGYQARQKGKTIEQVSAKLGHRSVIVARRCIGIDQDEINQIEDEVNI